MEMQATFKPRIRRLGTTRFLIESKTQPGVGHQVDTLHLTCSCKAGRHGRRCWHLVAALGAEHYYNAAEAEHRAHTRQQAVALPTTRLEESAGYQALMEAFA